MRPVPPRLWRAVLHIVVRGPGAEFVRGDLEEEYGDAVQEHGQAEADRRYRGHVLATARDWFRSRSTSPFAAGGHEARMAIRSLVRTPSYSLATALTLGLGLGGAAAVGALAESILRPLPFPDSHRLVAVGETVDGRERDVAPANYLDWRRESPAFTELAAYLTMGASITVDARATRASVAMVSSNFFATLGIRPLLGTGFDPTLDSDFPDRIAVISHGMWVDAFDSDPNVLGRTFRVEDQAWSIVGVAPAGFAFPDAGLHAWLRSRTEAPELRFLDQGLTEMRDAWYFQAVGRLDSGVSLAQARSETSALAARLARLYPDTNADTGITVRPLLDLTVGDFRSSLLALALTVLLLLGAATVNVTHLVLGRATARRGDAAVRVALGASQGVLIRRAVIEGMVLGFAGSIAGLALAQAALTWVVPLLSTTLPRAEEITLRVPAGALLMLGGVLIGAAISLAAFVATRTTDGPSARLRGRGWVGGAAANGLIAAQVAAAVTLLASAGVLARSLGELNRVELGFDTESLATARVALPDAWLRPYAERIAAYETLRSDIESSPGVRATFGSVTPLAMGPRAGLRVVGWDQATEPGDVGWQPVHPDYFSVVGMDVVAGRSFASSDRSDARSVGIVNQALVTMVFPDSDPVGREVTIGLDGHDVRITVVGVVSDTRTRGPASPPGPVLYRPIEQTERFAASAMTFLVSGGTNPSTLLRAMASRIRESRPDLPVYAEATGDGLVAPFRAAQSAMLGILGVFAATALLLGAVGIYGVASHATRRRRREIGVRMALGADRRVVLGSVLRQGLWRASIGIPIGIGASLLIGRALESLLYNVRPTDPTTLIVVSFAVLGVAAVALFLPARAAASTDPSVAVRAE